LLNNTKLRTPSKGREKPKKTSETVRSVVVSPVRKDPIHESPFTPITLNDFKPTVEKKDDFERAMKYAQA